MIMQVTLSSVNKTPELVLQSLFMIIICVYDAYIINDALLNVILIKL